MVGNKQLPKLHKHFELFYLNRLHFLGKQKLNKQEQNQQQQMFKPKLSKKTVEIAQNYRNKVADQINEKQLSTFDWLAATGNKEEWRKHAQQILNEEEMKECTFKPQIPKDDLSKSTYSRLDQTGLTSQRPKYEELYDRAKTKKARADKTKEEYEFERNKEQCTFQPQIKHAAVRSTHVPNQDSSSGNTHLQKYHDRMKKAREEAERKKRFTERGEVMPSELQRKTLNRDLQPEE